MIAFAAVLILAPQRAAAQSLSAQLTDKDITVSEFNAVNVSDDFEVTVSRGTYGVRLTVDKELAPYVEVYVRSKVLYISYDEKAVPKEIRKLYRGKGSLTPVFRVVAHTPELQAVTLSDNATLTGAEEFNANEFELTAAGKAQVKMTPDGVPELKMSSEAATRVTLTCPEPVALGATPNEAVAFWFALAPVTFEKGFYVEVA